MTKLLSKTQHTMAAWILSELASEVKWQEKFEKSAGILEKLAEEALKEHKQGKSHFAGVEPDA
ncbi:MAG: hypothetical protein HQM10_18405 [Candidatus Riflebacteria bacterium]|nr:hypothetical protein [Candidatus Riflebacteria bacterium]